MTTQRRHFRMPVSRCGLVTKEHTTTLCEIVDITEQRLHFSTDLLLSRNETVRIECQLDHRLHHPVRIGRHACRASSLRRVDYPVVARAPTATGSVHSASDHLQHVGIIAMPVSDPAQPKASSSQVVPVLCLLGVVVLLSSITPMMKYVFLDSSLTFLSIASGRIIIGFSFSRRDHRLSGLERTAVATIIGALSVLLGTELVRRKPLWAACSAQARVLRPAVAAPSLTRNPFRPSKGGYN
jgi:hypothetical protein